MGRCCWITKDMIERKINPDVVTFSALIDAFVKEGKLLEAEKLYEEMIKESLDEAKQMFALMVSKDCLPNVVTYSTLINGFCKCKRVEDAMELFREMSQRGLVGDTVTYNTLIQGFFQAGDCDNAQASFQTDGFLRVPPDIWTYNILLDGLCKNGKLESIGHIPGYAKEIRVERFKGGSKCLVQENERRGPLPNSGTYNTLIRARLRDGDKAASAELINEMKSCGFAADASTFGLVTKMLSDGRLNKSFLDMLS
ncbi:unnamed protein product [Microthlaspi erraticum]|uniref:Pentacotripeptide-repeat region of PRORP domain-containing protein n=1 Tax=Microthlaspi erraticum TaxID=1685480 RepID=A0A6D2J3Q1_9BRAS|nr:unnamed protein product [Microthlaspi erraticum]